MKGSSKKTMMTAAVLIALSSGTASAATAGTVDAQELFHANRLVTDHARQPQMKETAASDSYEASISGQKKPAASPPAKGTAKPAPQRVARLHWDAVDTQLAARSETPAFTLTAQKAKPVIITAADVKREAKQAEKEGRAPLPLVGQKNMQGEGLPHVEVVPQNEAPRVMPPHPVAPPSPVKEMPQPPAPQMPAPPAMQSGQTAMPHAPQSALPMPVQMNPVPAPTHVQPPMPVSSPIAPAVRPPAPMPAAPAVQPVAPAAGAVVAATAARDGADAERPPRPRYAQMPHEEFTLNPPADAPAPPKVPQRFDSLDAPRLQEMQRDRQQAAQPMPEHSVRPAGVPALSVQSQQTQDETLGDISDEVRRHILAGQLAMEIQLKKDPTVAGMRALTQILRENTTLTKLQKIDFLIGFGRALHLSNLPRQQQALLIKTIADSF